MSGKPHLVDGEVEAQLWAFERVFLEVSGPTCTALLLRSGRQSGIAVRYRELFSWLFERHMQHLSWPQLSRWLGRDASGLYRQARRLEADLDDPLVRDFIEAFAQALREKEMA